MEEKSAPVKREILMSLIQRYGNREPKILISKAKERGIYKLAQSDEEIYTLMERFAKFHNLPFGFDFTKPEESRVIEIKVKENTDSKEEMDPFFASMLRERSALTKKLLAINKLIEMYKNE